MESNELIKKVIGICYEVHTELGCGFVEKAYEKALMIALSDAGLEALSQFPIQVSFRGQLIGDYQVDIMIEGALIVELKAVSAIEEIHKAQLLNYLKAANQKTGLLVNFATLKLGVNRLYNRHYSENLLP